MRFAGILSSYVSLTKPTIVTSYALTGLTALVLEGSLLHQPFRLMLVLAAIVLTGASANGFNQYFERDIDAQMTRTKERRPLPQGKMSPQSALVFSIFIGAAAVLYLAVAVNLLSAAYALGTILFYSFFYTLWLKPRTHYNIVIGGAAGATAPLIAWAAGTGTTPLVPWLLFLVIFLWTPPHFWALSLCVKEQYAKVGIPMLPVVKGEKRTRTEIWWYSVILIALTLSLPLMGVGGWIYGFGALILGLFFIYLAWQVRQNPSVKTAYRLFGYSIAYLLFLFIMLMVDAGLKIRFSP